MKARQADTPVRRIVAMRGLDAMLAENVTEFVGKLVLCDTAEDFAVRCHEDDCCGAIISLNSEQARDLELSSVNNNLSMRYLLCTSFPESSSEKDSYYLFIVSMVALKAVLRMFNYIPCHWWELNEEGISLHNGYRKIMNRICDGFVRFDRHGDVLWANTAFYNILGQRRIEKKIGYRDVFSPGCIQAIDIEIDHFQHGIILPFTVEFKDGSLAMLDPTPYYEKNGKYDGFVAVIHPLDKEDRQVQAEFQASRTTVYLHSLSVALSQTLDIGLIAHQVITAVRRLFGEEVAVGVLVRGHKPVVDKGILNINSDMIEEMRLFCLRLQNKNVRIVKNLSLDREPLVPFLKRWGMSGALCFALNVNDDCLGHVWAMMRCDMQTMREKSSLLIATGSQVGMALRNSLNVESMMQEQAKRRRFYSDVLKAVTGNKLILEEYNEIDRYWEAIPVEESVLDLLSTIDVPMARQVSSELFTKLGVSDEVSFSMVTCISEAATNVVKYGVSGQMRIKVDDKRILARFDDHGPGIAVDKFPKALLTPGYSESRTPSLGLGFSVMLEMCKCVRIATGTKGTYIILEDEYKAHSSDKYDPLEAFVTFH